MTTTSNEEPPDGGKTLCPNETTHVSVPSEGDGEPKTKAPASSVVAGGESVDLANDVESPRAAASSESIPVQAPNVPSCDDNNKDGSPKLKDAPEEAVTLTDFLPLEVCNFLGSTLGISRCEELASADRWHIANALFQWHQARTGTEAKEAKERPLKYCQAQVYSWMARMNSLRRRQGLSPLVTRNGPNSIARPNEEEANEQAQRKGALTKGDANNALSSTGGGVLGSEGGGTPKRRKKGEKDAGVGGKKRRRVSTEIYGKKDMALAREMISKSIDLSCFLSPEECRFLGERLWIFSLQQLASALMIKDEGSDHRSDTIGAEKKKERQNLRDQLVDEVMKWPGHLIQGEAKESEGRSIPEDGVNGRKLGGSEEDVKPTGCDATADTKVESSTGLVVEIAIAPETGKTTKVDAAESLVMSWEEKVRRKKRDEFEAGNTALRADLSYKEQFPLDGAVSVLFPPQIICFLKSVGITTAFGLLSARKTENSHLLDLFVKWRENLKLPVVKPMTTARHLLGLSTRLRCALASNPPANTFTRQCMGNSLVVFTGGAYDFVILECKVTSDKAFVNTKTKDLADHLSRWRQARGMPVLKGSGSVATISGYKSLVKDVMEAEEGLLQSVISETDDDNIASGVAEDATDAAKMSSVTSATAREVPDVTKVLSEMSTDDATSTNSQPSKNNQTWLDNESLSSPEFLRSLLKPDPLNFLASVSIITAEQLIRVEKGGPSQIVSDLMEWRQKRGLREIQRPSCVRTIVGWGNLVKAKLDQAGVDYEALSKKRKGNAKEAKTAANDGSTGGGKEEYVRTSDKNCAGDSPESTSQSDPIDSLSNTIREFLATQEITKAEHLLGTKTSVLADAFLKWREGKGLRVLKGYGAVSSISVWKSTVRRSAAEKCGMSELADLNAATSIPRRLKSEVSAVDKTKEIAHPRILMGHSLRNFAVWSRNHGTGVIIYNFCLSVKAKKPDAESDGHIVCLTYNGARVQKEAPRLKNQAMQLLAPNERRKSPEILPEWESGNGDSYSTDSHQNEQNMSDLNAEDQVTFCAYKPGGGLIDLSSYCIFPLYPNDSMEDIQACLERFVLCQSCKPISESDDTIKCMLAFPHIERGLTEVEAANGTETASAWETVAETTGAGNESMSQAKELSTHEGIISRLPGSAASNVFLQQEGDQERQLLYLAEPIEKGQTVELILADVTKQADLNGKTPQDDVYSLRSNTCERIKVAEMLRSLSLSEMNYALIFIHGNILPAIASQMEQLLAGPMKDTATGRGDNDTHSNCSKFDLSCKQTSRLLASRRRLHFIAEVISVQASLLARHASDTSPYSGIVSHVKNLLWDNALLEKAGLLQKEKVLKQEVTEETISLMPKKGRELFYYPEWCSQSLELLDGVLKILSDYICYMGKDSSFSQEDLLGKIVQITKDAVKTLEGTKPTEAKYRLLAAVDGVVSSAVARSTSCSDAAEPDGHPAYSYRRLVEAVLQSPDERHEALSKECFKSDAQSAVRATGTSQRGAKRVHYHPKSLPIFLKTLWPILVQEYGWRINAGSAPGDVDYSPPDIARKKRKAASKTANDSEAARKRTRTSRRLAEAGIPSLPRTLKHVFLNFMNHVSHRGSSVFEFRSSAPVKTVVERFIQDIICEELDSDGKDRNQVKLQGICETILVCFDAMLPLILMPIERICPRTDGSRESVRNCEVYGSEYLLRLLIVLPDVLCQSAVPATEREKLCAALEDLAQYLSAQHSSVFDEGDHPPPEDYHNGLIGSSRKVLSLLDDASEDSEDTDCASVLPDGESDGTDCISVLRDSDRSLLTDFTAYAMGQVQICVAGSDDVQTSRRKGLRVGSPGFACLHCQSSKFFFSNPSSVGTLPSIVANHVQKCKYCPDAVKSALITKRQKHNYQKKYLQHGSQAVFYSRLWKRMSKFQSTETRDSASDTEFFDDNNVGEEGHGITGDDELAKVFKSHLEVMRYLVDNDLHRQDDLISCFETYYECLALGGDLWNTDAMPRNFTSEWLLKEKLKKSVTN